MACAAALQAAAPLCLDVKDDVKSAANDPAAMGAGAPDRATANGGERGNNGNGGKGRNGGNDDMREQVVSMYQKQKKIYPRAVTGWFATWRWVLVWATQLLFYGLPWLTWNARQAVLFDLGARRFYIFGLVLYPQDFIYLAGLLIVSALALFLFTAVAGRLWCGYACPQTVYTEIYLWVEQRFEGDTDACSRARFEVSRLASSRPADEVQSAVTPHRAHPRGVRRAAGIDSAQEPGDVLVADPFERTYRAAPRQRVVSVLVDVLRLDRLNVRHGVPSWDETSRSTMRRIRGNASQPSNRGYAWRSVNGCGDGRAFVANQDRGRSSTLNIPTFSQKPLPPPPRLNMARPSRVAPLPPIASALPVSPAHQPLLPVSVMSRAPARKPQPHP